jgi:transforming growth factor-beta-induced protein
MLIKTHIAVGVSLIIAVFLTAGWPVDGHAKRFKPGDDTIAEIAVTSDGFTTLVAALSCTGLVGAVADPDAELTVFAPSDAAFATAGLNATNICSSFDTETLTTILLYHVVGERRPSPSVINGKNKEITMLAGGAIYPVGKGSLMLNANNSTANIVAADILASNGVIHVIDFVLLP